MYVLCVLCTVYVIKFLCVEILRTDAVVLVMMVLLRLLTVSQSDVTSRSYTAWRSGIESRAGRSLQHQQQRPQHQLMVTQPMQQHQHHQNQMKKRNRIC